MPLESDMAMFGSSHEGKLKTRVRTRPEAHRTSWNLGGTPVADGPLNGFLASDVSEPAISPFLNRHNHAAEIDALLGK